MWCAKSPPRGARQRCALALQRRGPSRGARRPSQLPDRSPVSDKVSEASETIELGAENKRVALLIAALALALALTEVAGDDATTEAQMKNVESANLWAYFQARTIRQTVLSAEADRAASGAGATQDAARGALEQQVARWRSTVARWESEPE